MNPTGKPTANTTYPCPECGIGMVRPTAAHGRRWPYRNIPDLLLSSEFQIPTCDHCGAEWIGRDEGAQLDRLLSTEYRNALCHKAEWAINEIGKCMPQIELEPLLGLSAGYVSKLRHGKTPSAPLVACLVLIANDLARAEEIKAGWQMAPPIGAHGSAKITISSSNVVPYRPRTAAGSSSAFPSPPPFLCVAP